MAVDAVAAARVLLHSQAADWRAFLQSDGVCKRERCTHMRSIFTSVRPRVLLQAQAAVRRAFLQGDWVGKAEIFPAVTCHQKSMMIVVPSSRYLNLQDLNLSITHWQSKCSFRQVVQLDQMEKVRCRTAQVSSCST